MLNPTFIHLLPQQRSKGFNGIRMWDDDGLMAINSLIQVIKFDYRWLFFWTPGWCRYDLGFLNPWPLMDSTQTVASLHSFITASGNNVWFPLKIYISWRSIGRVSRGRGGGLLVSGRGGVQIELLDPEEVLILPVPTRSMISSCHLCSYQPLIAFRFFVPNSFIYQRKDLPYFDFPRYAICISPLDLENTFRRPWMSRLWPSWKWVRVGNPGSCKWRKGKTNQL